MRISGEEKKPSILFLYAIIRRAGMSDEQFAQDARWVREDLESLKNIMERNHEN